MVAIQDFVGTSEPSSRGLKLRRAQLRIASPAIHSLAALPEHLRTVATGILKEIDDRVFRPILEAVDLDAATTQAVRSFEVFANLWPAVLGALLPWMQENPDRLVAMGHVADDVWTSEATSRRIGEDACSWFAAAQDARSALAHAIMQDTVSISPLNEAAIVHRGLVADFALMFGLFLVHEPVPLTVPELPVTMAQLAYEAAKEAYVLATTQRFADRP